MVFDAPAPIAKRGHDFSENPLSNALQLDYKAGKAEAASVKMFFDGKLDESYIERGFFFYDKEVKARVNVPAFTAWVVGIYYGSFSNGQGKGDIRYMSNLVTDTRTDVVQSSYFMDNKRQTLVIGNYSQDIAPEFARMGRKSTYTRVMVAWVPEVKSYCQFHLNATSEAGILKAVAAARGLPEWDKGVNFFSLSELTTECWVFQFSGEFEPVVFSPKEAKRVPATVPATKAASTMFFQPVIKGGVFRTDNPTQGPKVAAIAEFAQKVSEYIASEQAFLRSIIAGEGQKSAAQDSPSPAPFTPRPASAPARVEPDDSNWPTTIVANDYTDATADLDGLPF